MWTLIVIVATALAGVVAFIANVIKSVESVQNIKQKKEQAAETKMESVELRLDLKDVGITPFRPDSHRIRNIVAGAIGGGAAVEIASQLHNHVSPDLHEHSAAHGAPAHLPDGIDASDHGATIADAHEAVVDHADNLLDWIGDILS